MENNPIVSENVPQAPIQTPITSQVTPMSQGQLEGPVSLLTSSWKLLQQYWKIIIPIVIAPTLLIYISQIFFISRNPALIIVAIALTVVGIIFSVASQPASINTIQRLSNEPGTVIEFMTQYRFGFKYFWSIILLAIIQTLIFFGSFVLLFIPAIIVGTYIGMFIFTLVIDGKKGFGAFQESFSLVYGRWLKVFGRTLFIALLYIVGAIIITGLSFVLSSLLSIQPKSSGEAVLNIIMNMILMSALSPLVSIYMYKLYISLKATRLPNVSTAGFKKWLIAFLVIGIIVVMVIPIIIFSIFGLVLARNQGYNLNRPTNWYETENINSSNDIQTGSDKVIPTVQTP